MQRRAKIVCTIGPASSDEETIEALIRAGMNVARLNFSHGSHEDHRSVFERIRKVSERLQVSVATLQDLQGPKIRLGTFPDGPVELVTGQRFSLYSEERPGNREGASVSYPALVEEVQPGDNIMLDDGLLHLRVLECHAGHVVTEVLVGGCLSDRKGVNLPSTVLGIASLTEKDRKDLAFGLELGVDFIALSFVRSALDVHHLRSILPGNGDAPHIIAKIEKPQAVENLEDIINATDGIMIARGDLGVELPPERVPIIQKRAIQLVNRAGKFAITATQMLESMTLSPRPTRAEASDVANAILDGTDAVMLSGETAAGRYPVETVRMMDRIIQEAEASAYRMTPEHRIEHEHEARLFPRAIAKAATVAAEELRVRAIICFTISGRTPRLIMSHRPSREILSFTPDIRTFRRMALYWGIKPVRAELRTDTDELIEHVEEVLRREHFAQDGDQIIIVMGVPVGRGTPTNMIKFHSLGYTPPRAIGDED